MIQLSVVEARVVGVLMEKETTTPEYYPLSLNATVNACNQKSSREPVMQLEEPEVRTALYELEQIGLVRTMADARVSKFEHRVREALGGQSLRRDEVAVICLLLLRGPQTPAELRARAERLYSFDDHQAVTATLERMAAREEPLVVLMARLPGAREARWMHLLCGPVEAGAYFAGDPDTRIRESGLGAPGFGGAEMLERVQALEARVEALEEKLRRFEG